MSLVSTKPVKLALAALFLAPFISCSGGGGGGGGSLSPIDGIGGKVEYVDRTYDMSGFTGTANLPVRYAKVQLMMNGNISATTTTDASGNYSFSSESVAGTIYVRALTESGDPYTISVMDNRDSSIYAVRSNDFTMTSGASKTVNLLAGTDGAGPPFNILDNAIKAQESLRSFSSSAMPALSIKWYDGSIEGTFFTPGSTSHTIALLGKPTDSDAYDDSVILHEVGHYAAEVYSKDSSPGGTHSIWSQLDLRLAWSEGWANFFQSLVKAVSGETNPDYYVDTGGVSTTLFSFSIETPSSTSMQGADNEVSVAAALWDIYDSGSNESFDTLAYGYDEIWNIFENLLPNASAVSFEIFWDGWESSVQAGGLSTILTERDIRYYADGYEDDDTIGTARTATDGTTETHTFFPAGDNDYWKINVTGGVTYRFEVTTTGDGADTLFTLFDSDQSTVIGQNDDKSLSNLGSRITWTANATKTVYLLSEPYRPLASGDPDAVVKYGYYTLAVTTP